MDPTAAPKQMKKAVGDESANEPVAVSEKPLQGERPQRTTILLHTGLVLTVFSSKDGGVYRAAAWFPTGRP